MSLSTSFTASVQHFCKHFSYQGSNIGFPIKGNFVLNLFFLIFWIISNLVVFKKPHFTRHLILIELRWFVTKAFFSMTACSYHVTYVFQGESTLYSCLNVKELLAQNRCNIWSLNDRNGTRTHNHLVCKQTFNHLAKLASLAKWLVFVYELSGCELQSRSLVSFQFLYFVNFALCPKACTIWEPVGYLPAAKCRGVHFFVAQNYPRC